MGKCGKCCGLFRLGAVISALVTRAVFTLHSLVAFWRIMVSTSGSGNHLYWLLLTGLLGLFIETAITVIVRRGAEYKWFCPSVFFYLATIVPCVWILELDLLDQRLFERENIGNKFNLTLDDVKEKGLNIPFANVTINFEEMLGLNFDIGEDTWVIMIEQVLLFILIFGRWMLPKGDITRDELSQLLLVYIGMAADIIEFFEAFKEEEVRFNWTLILTILAIWSASLLQFTLVLTASKGKKSRAGFHTEEKIKEGTECCSGCTTEVFGILTTMLLQDGPFLTLRLFLLVKYNVTSYMHLFFTVKNSLVLLLMVYRLFVLFDTNRKSVKKRQKQLESGQDKMDMERMMDTT